MFHMAKHSGIQSIFCDFRQATTSSLSIHSRFSHFMQRLVSCLPKNYSLVIINYEICHKTANLNSLEINHDHFPGMSSPNFRLSGGSLGYWTACNDFKRYCTLPCCVLQFKRPDWHVMFRVVSCLSFLTLTILWISTICWQLTISKCRFDKFHSQMSVFDRLKITNLPFVYLLHRWMNL